MLPWKSSKLDPLKQEDFLYGFEWDEKVDKLFAEVLSDHALFGAFNPNGGDNSNAISTTQYVVNKNLNKSFDLKTCWRQTHKLKKRYRVFSWLLTLEGIHCDESTNRIHVNTTLWSSIVKLEVFANAYEYFGDSCWEWLKILFGTPPFVDPQPIPLTVHQDIINIPSDDEKDVGIVYKQPIEIIDVDSTTKSTHGTSYWNKVARYNDDSDSKILHQLKLNVAQTREISTLLLQNHKLHHLQVGLLGRIDTFVSDDCPTSVSC